MDPHAYHKLLECVYSTDINVCDDVPSGAGHSKAGAKLTNPLGGAAHQVDGADRCGGGSGGVRMGCTAAAKDLARLNSLNLTAKTDYSRKRCSVIPWLTCCR